MAPKQRVEVSSPARSAAASSADLQAFIHRMDHESRLGEIMEVVGQAFGTASMRATSQAPGTMTDASKRLRDLVAPDSDQDWGFETVSRSRQGYSSTTIPGPRRACRDRPSPRESISRRAWTVCQMVCQLPKLASLNLSYSEIMGPRPA